MKNTITKIITISLCLLSFYSFSQSIPKDSLTKVEFYVGNKLMKKTEYIYSEDKVNCIVIDYETNDIYHTKFLLSKDSTTVLTYYNSEFVDSTIYYYDTLGKRSKKRSYLIPELQRGLPPEFLSPEVTYTKYNAREEITEILTIDYHMSDTFQMNYEYEYSDDKLLVQRFYQTYRGRDTRYKESFPNSSNEPISVDSTFFDGNLVTRQVMYRRNILSQEITNVRNSKGELIEQKTTMGKDFSFTQRYEYKQKNGKQIKLVRQSIKGQPSNDLGKYVYNSNDQLLEYTYKKDNIIRGKTIYKYDKQNRVTELLEYNNNGKKLELYSRKVYTYL